MRSPLDEADLTKDEIRELSRRAGLPTWDEPASACLSSRIPYHSEVTDEKLRTIERAEEALRALGFRVCRVRHHDDLARLEIGARRAARARSSRRCAPRIVARAEGGRLPLRHASICRATAPAASTKGLLLRPGVTRSARGSPALRVARAPGGRSSRSTCRSCPPSLEDLDSINFALGVRDFDVAQHQPHPPGYPRLHRGREGRARARADRSRMRSACSSVRRRRAAVSSRWSRCSAARSTPVAPVRGAVAAALLAVTSPLFWLTAARPLSDMPGLAASVAVQAMTLSARRRGAADAPRRFCAGAGDRHPLAGGLADGAAARAASLSDARTRDLFVRRPALAGPRKLRLKADAAPRSHARGRCVVWRSPPGRVVWAIPLVVLSGGPPRTGPR